MDVHRAVHRPLIRVPYPVGTGVHVAHHLPLPLTDEPRQVLQRRGDALVHLPTRGRLDLEGNGRLADYRRIDRQDGVGILRVGHAHGCVHRHPPSSSCGLGYHHPASTPTPVSTHSTSSPRCNEPVSWATSPTTIGPRAKPSPEHVLTRDVITATSRGRMPGNSNGSTSITGEAIQTTPTPVSSTMRSQGSDVYVIRTPHSVLQSAGTHRRSLRCWTRFSSTPPRSAQGMSP